MAQIAKHEGIVTAIENGLVKVEMHVLSACASCKAHEKCGFVDKADKVVEVEAPEWQQYHVGDKVMVSVNESLGLLAVLLAYFLPAIVIIAAVIVLSIYTPSEALVAFIVIALIAVYFVFLYFMRDKLQKKFSFGIER
ncbi:MAG: SoxR reducing system RseC family protein [Bacteroidales bacterium]|nr:SoxR reducing system RseC family protein [Bacteroidales bacterium]